MVERELDAVGCGSMVVDYLYRTPRSTGAGDAFLSAMPARFRWGMAWPAIGRLADAAGAIRATRLGTFPSGFELRQPIARLYGRPLPPRPFDKPTVRTTVKRRERRPDD